MPPDWTRHVAVALMWLAFICVTAAYIPRRHQARVLKHPMLVGVKLWAVAHLIANGDLGSIILFGSVLAWAVYRPHQRSSAAATRARRRFPFGGRRNDIVAIRNRDYYLFARSAYVFHPLWIGGSRVFGSRPRWMT